MTPAAEAFNWEDYLTLATELSDQESADELSEAKARCSVSRCYYAAYWAARTYAEAEGCVVRNDPHTTVWKWFRNKGMAKGAIASDGDRLTGRRIWADYKPNPYGLPGKVRKSLDLARECVEMAKTIIGWVKDLPPPNREGAGQ